MPTKISQGFMVALGLLTVISVGTTANPSASQTELFYSQEIQEKASKRANIVFSCDGNTNILFFRYNFPDPNKYEEVPLIAFSTKHFKDYPPETRCPEVAERYNAMYADGSLVNMIPGKINGYNVICAVTDPDQKCNDQKNQDRVLITLTNYHDPETSLKELIAPFEDIGVLTGVGEPVRAVHRNKRLISKNKDGIPYVNIPDLMTRMRYNLIKTK